MCNSGYTGQNCESDYIPCDPSPCLNGGLCHHLDNLNYKCTCPEGKCRSLKLYAHIAFSPENTPRKTPQLISISVRKNSTRQSTPTIYVYRYTSGPSNILYTVERVLGLRVRDKHLLGRPIVLKESEVAVVYVCV